LVSFLKPSGQFNWLQGEQKLLTFFDWIFGSDEKMNSQSPEVEISYQSFYPNIAGSH